MPYDARNSRNQNTPDADVEEFRRRLGPFVLAVETTPTPMVFTDARVVRKPIIFANQAFLDLTGYEEDEVMGQSFDFLMERGTDPEALAEIRSAFAGARDLNTQVRYRRKDDSTFWVTIFIGSVRNEHGTVVQNFASFVDITRQKEERDLGFLFEEQNQSSQSTLAIALAIAKRTLRRVTDKDVVDACESRIMTLLRAQSLVDGGSSDRGRPRNEME